jgi:bacterioferritin B
MALVVSSGNKLISAGMNGLINEQIGLEFSASLQYLSIAAYFDGEGLPQMASFFFRQSDEERAHAMRFINYLMDAGGDVEIPSINKPQAKFDSAEAAVQRALDGEILVTKQINALVDATVKEGDHITHNFLQWFVTEQLEEVSSMDTLLRMVRRAGEAHLLQVDEHLSINPKLSRFGSTGGGTEAA